MKGGGGGEREGGSVFCVPFSQDELDFRMLFMLMKNL